MDPELSPPEEAAEDSRRRSLPAVVWTDEERLLILNIDLDILKAPKIAYRHRIELHKSPQQRNFFCSSQYFLTWRFDNAKIRQHECRCEYCLRRVCSHSHSLALSSQRPCLAGQHNIQLWSDESRLSEHFNN
jgi:hypothetical protein